MVMERQGDVQKYFSACRPELTQRLLSRKYVVI
jgi:hypothetical protein